MSEKTPGQAAYEAFMTSCGLSITRESLGDWDGETDEHANWEAAAAAAIDTALTEEREHGHAPDLIAERHALRAELDAASDRCAGLFTELTAVTAERDELREQLSADLIVWNTCSACEAMERGVEQARAERDETRAAFAELAAHFGKGAQSGWTARISGTVLHRLCLAAKVPDPDGIIMGAGTAHAVAELTEEGR